MGWHLFFSICLGIAGTCVSAAFGLGSELSALIGLIIFMAYWGIFLITEDWF